jgi:RNA polymerase sigma factor (sigma-70 family)
MPHVTTSPPAGDIERVERAAAALSPLEREILTLSAGHGMRTGEIARRLGIGERRVQRLLARALRKFDRALCEPRRRWQRRW